MRLGTFALPLLGAMLLGEIGLRAIPHDFESRASDLEALGAEIEVLILGNSHAFRGVNPSQLSSPAYNLAYVSQSYPEDLALLQTYGEDMTQLRAVVLSLSYPSPYHVLAASPEDWRLKDYARHYSLDGLKLPLRYRSEVLSTAPRLQVRRAIDYYLKGEAHGASGLRGFARQRHRRATAEEIEESGAGAAERHSYALGDADALAHQRTATAALEAMVTWAEASGLAVVLTTVPTHPAYHTRLEPTQVSSVRTLGERLAAGCRRCVYIDALADGGYGAGDFRDGDHLSAAGATKFTAVVDSALATLDVR